MEFPKNKLTLTQSPESVFNTIFKVFKWIFAACDLSQEEWETPNSLLYYLLRIFMAISFLVYLYYIKRRLFFAQ